MAKASAPKGTLIRNAPDWFYQDMAFCGANDLNDVPVNTERFSTFALFNNDTLGRDFLIYYISLSYEGADMGLVDLYKGSFGTAYGHAYALRPSDAQPPGLSFVNSSAPPSPATNPDITDPIMFLAAAFTGQQFGYGAPIFIVPAGYSMRVSNDDSSEFNSITWWYRIASEAE